MRGALVVRAGLLRREQGLALPIVLGMMLVFGLALGGVMTLSGSSEQSAAREKQSQTAFGAGEASLATAISQLATAANPRSSSSLPSCAAPATLAFAGSTGDYCGTLTGDDWTITARGFAKTTAAGGQQTRRITQVASILPFYHGGLGELWNRVYQWDTSKCVEFKKIILTVPVVTRSCVKLKGNSSKPTRLLGTYVSIAGYVELEDSDSIGLSSNPIARADIGGTCDLKHGSGPHSPCGPADAVYATAISTSTPDLGRPTVDFAYWYANAKPGPKFPCTVGSLPSGSEFEKAGDLAYDGDAKKMDLTPKDESYTCQHWSGGEMLGELSWNHVTKVLKVTGAIFFDGEMEAKDKVLVNYQGKGTIYSAGKFELEEAFCAGGNGTNNCLSSMSNWDPAQNLLILATGGLEDVDKETFKMDKDEAAFQGAVWSQGKCKIGKKASISSPLICGQLGIKEDDSIDDPTINPWPPSLIGPRPGQLYSSPNGDFQILLREQLG